MPTIKWGNVFQYLVIGLAAFIAVKLAVTNWLGLIAGGSAGAYITYKLLSAHYARKYGANQAQATLHGAEGYYGVDPYQHQTGYQPALTTGQQAYGQYDHDPQYEQPQQAYADQGYTCGTCGGRLLPDQGYYRCEGCGQYYQ